MRLFKILLIVFLSSGIGGCALTCKKGSQIEKVTENQNRVLTALKKERTEDEKLVAIINKFTLAKEKERRLMLSINELIKSNNSVIGAVREE